ncbi:MAG TPA: lysophospholipid acyltransferase family protein [Gammaproteobacteria bacterium]|nr:lysophospholipid acyltransferase family protein [Gammaproteobacteria bacterium]
MRPLLIKSFLYLCAYLPLPVLHATGASVGWLLILLPNQLRKAARVNLELCFKELSTAQRRQLLHRCLVETGKTLLETGVLWLRPAQRVLRLIRRVDGLENIEHALAKGRGLILATPHLGAWELSGLYCAAHYDITCLYRPLRITGLETLVNKARSRAGGHYVPANARGLRTLFKTLEEGGTVAMLPDQEPRAGTGVFAPFFGIPALSMVFLSRLTAKRGAPIVFVWCERLGWGRGYHLHFRQAPDLAYAHELETSVTGINQAVENCIRECPAQYQWGYRRFRARPEGEPPFY